MGVKHASAYCPQCEQRVLGTKNTHRLRNTVAVGMALGVGSKVESCLCPQCGGRAMPIASAMVAARKERAAAVEEGRDPAAWAHDPGLKFPPGSIGDRRERRQLEKIARRRSSRQ